MKILRIIASMDPKSGGPCQGIRHSITEMGKRSIVNDVVCLDVPTNSYLTDKIDSFTIYALGPAKTAWQYNGALFTWLESNMENYDAVIVHGLWLYHGYAGYRVAKNLRNRKPSRKAKAIKFFVMPHGMLDPYFQKAGSRKLKAIRNFFYWYLIESRIVHFADGLLFTSKTELELARQTFSYYNPQKELNIGYGIPSPPLESPGMEQQFRRLVNGLNGRPYIIFLSRIHEKKGVDLLVEAYKYYLDKRMQGAGNENDNFPCLVIAGPGWDDDYGKMIKEKLASEPIYKDMIFSVGMITGDAKWGGLKGAEAFILPSHQENFGIAVVEAMACRTPVLISNQINIWQDIEQANAGIVKQDTVAGVRDLLGEWFGVKEDMRLLMREKAYLCFSQQFHISKPTGNLLEAINAA